MAVYFTPSGGLALQIEKRNSLHKTAGKLHSVIAAILSEWIGKKVVKVTPYDSWVSALKKRIDEATEEVFRGEDCQYRVTYRFSENYVHADLDIIFDAEHRCFYKNCIFSCCSIDLGVLTEVAVLPELKTDYDFSAISAEIRELSDLKDRVRNLESSLRHFTVH